MSGTENESKSSPTTAANVRHYQRWKARAAQHALPALQYDHTGSPLSPSAMTALDAAVQNCFLDAQVAYSTLRTYALETDPLAAATILGVRLIADHSGRPSTSRMTETEPTAGIGSYPAVKLRHHPTWPVPRGYVSAKGLRVLDGGLSELRRLEALSVFEICETGQRQIASLREKQKRSEQGR